jgi:hypothetical protein
MTHNNITKKKEFKRKSSINRNLKVYKKFSKKQIAEYKLKCNDDSKHVGNWCSNQKIRFELNRRNKDSLTSKVISEKELYDLREELLDNNIENIYNEFYSKFDINKNSVRIYPTGSTMPWSDKDVQITLNLVDNYTYKNIKDLTDIIIKLRVENQTYFFPKNKKIFDIYYDINFYMPSLFHFLYLPKSKKQMIEKYKRYCYISDIDTEGKNISTNVVLKPDFSDNPKQFLLIDISRILLTYNMDLDKCFKDYKKIPSKALVKIIEGIKLDGYFRINTYLHKLVSLNHVCAEMYFSVCSTIFVVWYMQINNMKTNSKQLLKDLKYLAIPAFIENHLMFSVTKKDKYLNRKIEAFKHLDKDLLIELLKKVLKKKKTYSKQKIKILKDLLVELET